MKISKKKIKKIIKNMLLESQNSSELQVIKYISSSWEASKIRHALFLGETLGMFKIQLDYDFGNYTKFELIHVTPAFKSAFIHAVNEENDKNEYSAKLSARQGYPPNEELGGFYGQGRMYLRGPDYESSFFIIESKYL